MKFTYVSELPKRNRPTEKGRKLQRLLEAFYASDLKVARLDADEQEYRNKGSMVSGINRAIKSTHLPIRSTQRNGQLYIYKISAEDELL